MPIFPERTSLHIRFADWCRCRRDCHAMHHKPRHLQSVEGHGLRRSERHQAVWSRPVRNRDKPYRQNSESLERPPFLCDEAHRFLRRSRRKPWMLLHVLAYFRYFRDPTIKFIHKADPTEDDNSAHPAWSPTPCKQLLVVRLRVWLKCISCRRFAEFLAALLSWKDDSARRPRCILAVLHPRPIRDLRTERRRRRGPAQGGD